jgi:PTH1 family peptidyl-tRNA hydrolase
VNSAPLQLILGLGNPGEQYAGTRHNLGFMALETLASHYNIDLRLEKKAFNCRWGKIRLGSRNLILALPHTFMNLSGRTARSLASYFQVEAEAIAAVHDDLDLEFGRIKISVNRGGGGHKGVDSLRDHLGSDAFARLRLGIGRPLYGEAADRYVLNSFYPEQKAALAGFLENARQCLLVMIEEGPIAAMQVFNRR